MRTRQRAVIVSGIALALGAWALGQWQELPERPRTPEQVAEYKARRARVEAALGEFKQAWRDGRVDDATALVPLLAAAGARGAELEWEIDQVLRRDLLVLAKQMIERFPDARPREYERLFRNWDQFGGKAAELDAWLAALARESDHWLEVRVRRLGNGYRAELQALLDSMRQAVRERPGDIQAAHRLAVAAKAAGDRSYDWVADGFTSPNASDYLTLDSDYRGIMASGSAARMLERALELKPNDADRVWVERRRMMMAALPRDPLPRWEEELRTTLRRALLDAYKRAEMATEAQALIEALMAENDGHLPVGLQYAGQIQAMSGARVVQKKVLDAEADRGDTPEYWRERGDYFAGRKEWQQAEAAYLKSLELAAPEGTPGRISKSWALSTYLNLLRRIDMPRAYDELWKRSEGLPPDRVLWLLVQFEDHYQTPIRGDDERCWQVLAANPRWSYGAERVLMKMLEKPGPLGARQGANAREAVLLRAAELAKDADGTRSAVLVSAMQRTGSRTPDVKEPLDAVQLLEYAVSKNAPDAHGDSEQRMAHEATRRALAMAYLQRGDWRKSLAAHPQTGVGLAPFAIAAAKAGDLEEAMRLWREVSAADRMHLAPLRALRGTPLRQELITFYQRMARELPGNAAPPRALEILDGD